MGSDAWQRVNATICVATQLNISNLIEGRQYEFRVTAQNEAGLSLPSTNSTSVKIKDPKAPTAPEIVKPLRNVNVAQNHNAQFQCTIAGTPKPTITWYLSILIGFNRNVIIIVFLVASCKFSRLTLYITLIFRYKGAREITQSARFHMFAEGENYTLIINDVYGEDADEYHCRAVNKGGVKSTRAELFIMSKLEIVQVAPFQSNGVNTGATDPLSFPVIIII